MVIVVHHAERNGALRAHSEVEAPRAFSIANQHRDVLRRRSPMLTPLSMTFLLLIPLSNRHQPPLHRKHFCNRHIEGFCDLERKEHGRVRMTILDAHDGLSAHSGAHRELLLGHASLEAQNANTIADGHIRHKRA